MMILMSIISVVVVAAVVNAIRVNNDIELGK